MAKKNVGVFFLRGLILIALLLIRPSSFCQLTAGFTVNVATGCSPLSVVFNNTSTGTSAATTFLWDFGNGNSSTLQNPGAVFINERTYTVILTIKDGNLSSAFSRQITVAAAPSFDFTVSQNEGCTPFMASFSAIVAPANTAANFTWDFGDGNTLQSTSAAATHNYLLPGNATVSLAVSNSAGCTKIITKQNLVKILPPLAAVFSAENKILCRIADSVRFLNSSNGPGTLSYLWDFGDGGSSALVSPFHVFNTRGIYNVKLNVSSSEGCNALAVQNGLINVASFSSSFSIPLLVCSGTSVNINNSSLPFPTASEWWVDGFIRSAFVAAFNYYAADSGIQKIELKNVFGSCRDSVSQIIQVKKTPDLSGFLSNLNGNCGAPVVCNFIDTTADAVSWKWLFDYPSPVLSASTRAPAFTYMSDGGYNVQLTVTNAAGCSATAVKYVAILRPFISIIDSGSAVNCGAYTLGFSASISPPSDSIATYNWNFGDGSTSVLPRPVHLFANPGFFSVTLSYTTLSGCTGTVSYGVVTVNGKPRANFSARQTTVCGNTPVVFTAQSSGFNYIWNFGDGLGDVPSFGSNSISYSFSKDTIFTVRLIVFGSGGCSDTLTIADYIKVLPPFPIISGSSNTCDGNRGLVTLLQTSVKALDWKWAFGDGATKYLTIDSPSVTHQYAATGIYRVYLTTTNGVCSVSDSALVHVFLKQSPLLSAFRSKVCVQDQLPFTISELEKNTYPYFFGSSYGFAKIAYTDFSIYNGLIQPDIGSYNWDTLFTGSFNNFDTGKNGIRIILQSTGFGCFDTTNFIPLVVNSSTAGFKVIAANRCFKLPVIFKDTSFTNTRIRQWLWDFGDGTSQTFNTGGNIVTHFYNSPGSFTVTLTVYDTSGCSSNSQATTVDANGPKAAFSASATTSFITLPVSFYNNSNEYNSVPTLYSWSFGDGAFSSQFSPEHAYALPGAYTVKLIAYNAITQCSDTATQVVIINNFNPAFGINTSFLSSGNCPPLLAKFSNNSSGAQYVSWDFGDGNTAGNLDFPSHVYENAGTYIITLYVYGSSGLTAIYKDSVSIKQAGGQIKTDKNEGCIGTQVALTATSSMAGNFVWDMGDGRLLLNRDSVVRHVYTATGIYKPVILLTNADGCSKAVSLPGNILIRPNPSIVIQPDAARICKGQSVILLASGGQSYEWLPAQGLSNLNAAAVVAKPDSSSTYSVTGKDTLGCSSNATAQVLVVQPQKLLLNAATKVCSGNLIRLNASGTDKYEWINNTTGLNNRFIPNPAARPLANAVFTVRGTDSYNCFSDTASIVVSVLPLPTVIIPPVPPVLLGNSLAISSVASPDVIGWIWYPPDNLSCSDCPNPVSRPLAETIYTLTVFNNNGCFATAGITVKLQCEEARVFIPAAFSPNGDGINDYFLIKGISTVRHLLLYNRWGHLVFEGRNLHPGQQAQNWDGTYKGEPQAAGTYTYFAELQCPAGAVFVRKGTVVLLR